MNNTRRLILPNNDAINVLRDVDLKGGKFKLFGSVLTNPFSCSDIDVAVNDEKLFAYLLTYHASTKLRPMFIEDKQIFNRFEEYQSIYSDCKASNNLHPVIRYSPNYGKGNQFNLLSLKVFNRWDKVKEKFKRKNANFLVAKLFLQGIRGEDLESILLNQIKIPYHVYEVLKKYDGIITGGIWRDIFLGYEPKDIDYFLVKDEDKLVEDLKRIKLLIYAEKNYEMLTPFNLWSFCSSILPYNLEIVKFNFLSDPKQIVTTFDFLQNTFWFKPKTLEFGFFPLKEDKFNEIILEMRNGEYIEYMGQSGYLSLTPNFWMLYSDSKLPGRIKRFKNDRLLFLRKEDEERVEAFLKQRDLMKRLKRKRTIR